MSVPGFHPKLLAVRNDDGTYTVPDTISLAPLPWYYIPDELIDPNGPLGNPKPPAERVLSVVEAILQSYPPPMAADRSPAGDDFWDDDTDES